MNESSYRSSVVKYCVGFGLSLVLSFGAYVVATEWNAGMIAIALALLGLAILQLLVQLRYFLHLSTHPHSVLRTNSIAFTLLMMLVIVIGSLWIMNNLDYRMGMDSDAMMQYMLKQNRKGF